MAETKCMLSFEDQDKKSVLHVERCETVAYALKLRSELSSMLQSFPVESIALDLVNKITGERACREFILNSQCLNHNCPFVHDVALNFDLHRDFKTSFILFSRWYLLNSKCPNVKMVLELLSFASRDFGDELLLTILCFSQALLTVARSFRRTLRIELIEKLVHLLGFTKTKAIRTILIFNVTQNTKDALITDLLQSLGVYEEDMNTFYESLSCIWHVNGNYSFSHDIFFSMLKECLQEMPSGFAFTKGKMIEELLKCPCSVLKKNLVVVERFLLKYYSLNSFAAHKVRCFAYYGIIPEPDESTRSKTYQSSTVKGFGPVNWSWEYLDLTEELQKSLGRRLCKILNADENLDEATVVRSNPRNLNMEELLDVTDVGSNLKLLALHSNISPPTGLSKYVRKTREAMKHRKYELIFDYIIDSVDGKCLDSYMDKLGDMLVRLVKHCELPRVVDKCLSSLSNCGSRTMRSLIRNRFSVTINSIILMFYEKRDFKSAVKLLDALRAKEVDPLCYPPNKTTQTVFAVVCSDINFECLRMSAALDILLSNDCLKYVKFNCTFVLSNHFRIIERLVVKMLKCFNTKRLPSLSLRLFTAVLEAQKDLFYPIDIGKYYEIVLCNTYIACEEPCAPLDGARLFKSVYKRSGHEEVFRSTTFRSLIVDLVRLEASSVARILELSIHYRVYPPITPGLINLGTHLLVEEMYVYLYHCFKKFSDVASSEQSCTVKLIPTSKPVRKWYPFLEDLRNVDTGLREAGERFKEGLRRIIHSVKCPSPTLHFLSPSEIVILPLIKPPSDASSEDELEVEISSDTSLETEMSVHRTSNNLSKDEIGVNLGVTRR